VTSDLSPIPLPTLETERLILRGWKESDFDTVIKIFCDEENARYIGGVKAPWQAWRHMALFYGHWHLRGYTNFAVEEKATGKTIGSVGPWFPHGWPEPEIGYSLAPIAHGKGYATEAAIASLKHAYSDLGWETAISMIDKENIGSKKVASKMGATFEKKSILFEEHEAEIWRHLPPEQFMEKFA